MNTSPEYSQPHGGAAVMLTVVLFLTAAIGRADTPPASTAPPFAPSSFWNAPLADDAPLDPNSDALVRKFVELVQADQQARRGPWINTREYSMPVYTVKPEQARLPVKFPAQAYLAPLQKAMDAGVPMPPEAEPAAGTDAHMVVWQPATDTMWEFWAMRRNPSGEWTARWGGKMEHVSESPGYYHDRKSPSDAILEQASWGSTACSLPAIGGLMRIDELQSGRIPHALQFMLPDPRRGEFSWPAQRTDGTDTSPDAIPEGARFRIDPQLDLGRLKLHPVTRMMAEAVQRYGMVVNDRTNHCVGFRAEDPMPLVRAGKENPYPAIFRNEYPTNFLADFPWEHLQLLKMDLFKTGQTHP